MEDKRFYQEKYPMLFSPLKVGNIILKNRIATAPTQQENFVDGENKLTREAILFYAGQAKGGAGLISLGTAKTDDANSTAHPSHLDLTDDSVLSSLHFFTDIVHSYGARTTVELNHNGQFALPQYCHGLQPMAASAMILGDGNIVREMNEDDMEFVAETYVKATKMAQRGGIDGMLMHFGHGWLFGGFLSNLSNHRTDKYGGSIENRCRFPLMVLEKVRQAAPHMLLELRLSGDEYTPGGIVIEECIEMAKIFAPYVDMMHISCGTRLNAVTRAIMHPTHFVEAGHNASLSARVKKAVDIPVGAIGGINTPELAERIIAEGQADYVMMARSFIADINWAKKAKQGRAEDIVPCIKCLRCLDVSAGRLVGKSKTTVTQDWSASKEITCTVNPEFGRLSMLDFYDEPQKKKRVAIIGGGPAGMEAALKASERGHEVVLFEKEGKLGGQLFYTDYVWFKKEMKNFRDYLIKKVQNANIKVCLNTLVDAEIIKRERFDAIVVAIGAEPYIPPIPGVKRENVHTAIEIYGHENILDDKVVIIGGGMVGCETALHLSAKGKEVVLVEAQELLAPDGYFSERLHTIDHMDRDEKISYYTSAQCREITAEGVIVIDQEGNERLIAAQSVVLSTGMRARSKESEQFYNLAEEVIFAGDCEKAGTLYNATRQGYNAGLIL